MLKAHAALSLALGGVLSVPILQTGEPADLRESLSATVATLEHLAGLEQRIERGDDQAVEELLTATEPAPWTPMERDAFLTTLRQEVGRLQMQHEGLAVTPTETVAQPSQRPAPVRADLSAPLAQSTTRTSAKPERLEPAGYSADPLRQGRLFCLAGRFGEAREVLTPLAQEPSQHEAAYWLAHASEHLGRIDDAIAGYTRVAESEAAGSFAQRAARDLEFLRWRLEFEARHGGQQP